MQVCHIQCYQRSMEEISLETVRETPSLYGLLWLEMSKIIMETSIKDRIKSQIVFYLFHLKK